jgi:hypothetical protein
MDIKELKAKRNQLQRDLAGLIANRVRLFTDETGISPDFISVDMVNVTTAGGLEQEYVVGSVTVSLAI